MVTSASFCVGNGIALTSDALQSTRSASRRSRSRLTPPSGGLPRAVPLAIIDVTKNRGMASFITSYPLPLTPRRRHGSAE